MRGGPLGPTDALVGCSAGCLIADRSSSHRRNRLTLAWTMLNTYRKLLSMLDPRERRRAGLVFLLMLSIAVSEVLGVASVMPFMAVLANQEVVDSNKYLAGAFQLFGFERRESFLFALGLLFFVLLLGSLSLKALGLWAQMRFSYNRSFVWSSRLVAAYLRQPYEWFLNRHSADLATSILAEVDDVVWNALIPMLQVVAQSMVAVLLLALLVAVEPRLALIIGAIVGGGFAAISYFFRLRLTRPARWARNRRSAAPPLSARTR